MDSKFHRAAEGAWHKLTNSYLTPILKSVGVTSAVQTVSLNAGLAMWNLTVCQLAATQVERISRRTSFFTSGIGMAITMAIVTGFSAAFANGTKALGLATIPFLFFFFFFYDVGSGITQSEAAVDISDCVDGPPLSLLYRNHAVPLAH